jgi:hypothetical protein
MQVATRTTAGTLRTALGLPCNISSVLFELNTWPASRGRLYNATTTPELRCSLTTAARSRTRGVG